MEIKRQSVAFNILRNFKETEHIMTVENVVNTINDNFNKGLIDELTVEEAFEQLDNLLEKGHKYYRREGSPGNYKYYYTEEQYNKEKGKKTENKEAKGTKDKKEDGNIVDNVNNGEIINSLFKEWNSIKTPEQHKKWTKKVANTKFGTYKDKTILNVMSDFNPKFPNEIIKKDFINEVQEAYKNSGAEERVEGSDIKVGQKYHSPAPEGGEAIDFVVKRIDNGKYTIETINKEGRKGEHTFDEKTIKELISESKPKNNKEKDKTEDSKENKSPETIEKDGKKYKLQPNGKYLEISEHGMTKKEHSDKVQELQYNNSRMDNADYADIQAEMRENDRKAEEHHNFQRKLSDKEFTKEELEGDGNGQ